MQRKKLISGVFALLMIAAISFGFYQTGDNHSTLTVAPNSDGMVRNSNNLPDVLVGAWTSGANITTQDYFGGSVGYTRNDSGWVYICGGNEPSAASTICQRYNVNANTYTTIAAMPNALVVNGCANIKDSIYAFGGYLNGSAATNLAARYNINTNTWAAIAPMPAAGAFCKGVGYQDSLMYVAEGYTGATVVANVFLYNSLTNTWRQATPMPGARFGGAFSRSGDTLVYVGGADLSLFYNQTYRGVISQSDRSVITWTTGAVCPGVGAGMYRMDLAPWGCKGLIMTGGSVSGAFTDVSNICYLYSPGANVWTVQANKPTAWTCGQSGSVKIGNAWKLACCSGYNGSGTIAGTEIFTDTLCPSASFPTSTTCRNGLNIAIPDNLPIGATDSLSIPGSYGCTILDVNVKIDSLTHTYDSDLTFDLTHGSTTVRIINQVGTSFDNFFGTILNDSASTPIASGVAPFTGSFQPSNPLSAFNTTSTNGRWTLLIVDHANLDTGFLKAWCVTVTYQCPTGGISTIEIPSTYKLSQNYPNPFNPTTTISYGLPKSGNVKLVVYDILGREVKTLVNEFKNQGTYNIAFDASSLASGVYFYTLKANDFSSTKKMLLVK